MRSIAAGTLALIVSLTAPAGSAAQDPSPDPVDAATITVQATGEVEREPDRATVRFAVETSAPDAEAAAAENARQTDAVLTALREAGLDADDLRTVGYRLQPRYETARRPDGRVENELVGYTATNMIEATVDEIARTGEIIDVAIAAGANRVDYVAFGLRDAEAARRAALQDAVTRARADAQALAAAAGRRLGPVLRIASGGAPIAAERMATRAADVAEFETPTPIEPGPLTIQATATVVFRLEG